MKSVVDILGETVDVVVVEESVRDAPRPRRPLLYRVCRELLGRWLLTSTAAQKRPQSNGVMSSAPPDADRRTRGPAVS